MINKTSQNRKVTDACGHFICLSCLLKGRLCKKCHVSCCCCNFIVLM